MTGGKEDSYKWWRRSAAELERILQEGPEESAGRGGWVQVQDLSGQVYTKARAGRLLTLGQNQAW